MLDAAEEPKVIEESPSPSVDDALRQMLIDVSLKAAKAVGYRNAGHHRVHP